MSSLTYEAIRQWCLQFGQDDANQVRRPRPGDKWYRDEVCLTSNGKRHYGGRAVDQDDNLLTILVQSRRYQKAAQKFFRKVLKELHYVPRGVITEKRPSYGAALRALLPGVEPRQSRSRHNRCATSHRPPRQREYRLHGFQAPGHAQRFWSASGPLAQHDRPRRPRLSASAYRQEMRQRFARWAAIAGTKQAA